MKIVDIHQARQIGQIIRSISEAQAIRLFKSEKNTSERAAVVYLAIRSQITLALFDAGITLEQILQDIDPTDDILDAMFAVGFAHIDVEADGETLVIDGGEDEDEGYTEHIREQ